MERDTQTGGLEQLLISIEHLCLLLEYGTQDMIDFYRKPSGEEADETAFAIANTTIDICVQLITEFGVPYCDGQSVLVKLELPNPRGGEIERMDLLEEHVNEIPMEARPRKRTVFRTELPQFVRCARMHRKSREHLHDHTNGPCAVLEHGYKILRQDAAAEIPKHEIIRPHSLAAAGPDDMVINHLLHIRRVTIADYNQGLLQPENLVDQGAEIVPERIMLVTAHPVYKDGLQVSELETYGWASVSVAQDMRSLLYSLVGMCQRNQHKVSGGQLFPDYLVVRCSQNCARERVFVAPEWMRREFDEALEKTSQENPFGAVQSLLTRLIDLHQWAYDLACLCVGRLKHHITYDKLRLFHETLRDLVRSHVRCEQPAFLNNV